MEKFPVIFPSGKFPAIFIPNKANHNMHKANNAPPTHNKGFSYRTIA
jgi:hypothetical protein